MGKVGKLGKVGKQGKGGKQGTAQILLLQFFPSMAGLQPPVLQKVFSFQVHSGEFVQIIHVRNNHWCVVSTVGCEAGAVHVYDSLCKIISKETVRLIASLVYSPCSELTNVLRGFDVVRCA